MRYMMLALIVLAGGAFGAVDDGLVAHWTFEEGHGAETTDVTSSALKGVLQGGVSWTDEGVLGKALMFDGKSSSVSVASTPKTDLKMLTLSAWINASQPGGVMSFATGHGWKDERAVVHYYASKGCLRFTLSNGEQFITAGAASPTPLNQWVHVAVTYDGHTMTIYENGLKTSSKANESIYPNTGGVAFSIGRVQGLTPNVFTGRIDEVRIYNRALSAKEVESLFTALAPKR